MKRFLVNKSIFVGVIQTSLDYEAAWMDDKMGSWQSCVQISATEELRAKSEIRHYLSSLKGLERRPDIILLPELSIPTGFESRLAKAAESLESILIAGLDYRIESGKPYHCVSNEALVIVPRRLGGKKISQRTEIRRIGKTYPAPAEKRKLKDIPGGGVEFLSRPEVWIFNSDDLGNFAIAVCYDFLDLDRMVLYRNKIQTLFILAYNKDTTSFDHLAEAVARMVFCNVVVCNCGLYGGSLAVSPFSEPFKRIVYRHTGQKLPNAQLIELPLALLKEHQEGGRATQSIFKSLPPGFPEKKSLKEINESI